MLSLERSPGEYLVIDNNIVIQVVSTGKDLRLVIDAPREIPIVRGEVYEKQHPIPDCLIQTQLQGKIRKTGKTVKTGNRRACQQA